MRASHQECRFPDEKGRAVQRKRLPRIAAALAALLLTAACGGDKQPTVAAPKGDRVFITFGGLPPEELKGKGADFVAAYKAKFGSTPEGYAIYGYVAAQVAIDALRRTGRADREALRVAVSETEQIDGPLGSWRFTTDGDTTLTTMSGNTVRDGKFAFVTVLGGGAAAGSGARAKTDLATIGDPAAPKTGPVKFVSSLPLTGSASAQSGTIVNGIRLALEETGGKIGDFSVAYESWDDASAKKGDWDPEVEAQNADRAAKDPSIHFYLGTYNSGAAKIAMPILNQANLVMISPANTYTGLTKPGLGEPNEPAVYRPTGKVNYHRVVPADDIQGKVGAEWMKAMGAKRVYVLDDRGLYGKGIADVFVATAEELGLTVVGREGTDPKAQEYRSLMTKIKAANPDFVYFGGTTQTNAGQISKDMVAVGLDAKLMLPDGCFEQAFISAAGL